MGFFFYGWIFLLTFQCYHPQLKKKKKKKGKCGLCSGSVCSGGVNESRAEMCRTTYTLEVVILPMVNVKKTEVLSGAFSC